MEPNAELESLVWAARCCTNHIQLEFIRKAELHFSYGNQKKWEMWMRRFFPRPLRVCKWAETLGQASGWAWVWIGTLHLGHMCRQQGQKLRIQSQKFFLMGFLLRQKLLYTVPQICTFLTLHTFSLSHTAEKLLIIKCVYETMLLTLRTDLYKEQIYSVVVCTLWCGGNTKQSQTHNPTEDKTREEM